MKDNKAHRVWKPKVEVKAFIAQNYDWMSSRNKWVLDNGFLKHMVGKEAFLEEVKPFSQGYVTFGYGRKERNQRYWQDS